MQQSVPYATSGFGTLINIYSKMDEFLKYRISFVIRDRLTKEIIKERILHSSSTNKLRVLELYLKYLNMFKEKTPECNETFMRPEWVYSLEILNGNKIFSQTFIFQKTLRSGIPPKVRFIMKKITKALNNFASDREKEAGIKIKKENRYIYDSKENRIKINKNRSFR